MKRIIFSFFFTLLTSLVIAQGWVKSYPVTCNNCRSEIVDIAPTYDEGNIALEHIITPKSNGIGFDTAASLLKVDQNGVFEWRKDLIPNATTLQKGYSIVTTPDSGYLVNAYEQKVDSARHTHIGIKLNSQGDTLWKKVFNQYWGYPYDIKINTIVTSDENYIFGDYQGGTITKLSPQGNVIWENTSDFNNIYRLLATPNNEILVLGYDNIWSPVVARLSQQGSILWKNTQGALSRNIMITDHNELLLHNIRTNTNSIIHEILKLDINGNHIWSLDISNNNSERFEDIAMTADSNYVIIHRLNNSRFALYLDTAGNTIRSTNLVNPNLISPLDDISSVYLDNTGANIFGGSYIEHSTIWNIVSNSSLISNVINGKVYYDINNNCQEDIGEQALKQWVIEVEQNGFKSYVLTDTNGVYSIPVNIGNAIVNAYPPFSNSNWSNCQSNQQWQFSGLGDTTTLDFGLQAAVQCPVMFVDIGTSIIRQCCDNIYTVQYCNYGTKNANNAYVEVDIDDGLVFVSSSITPTNQVGNTYTFPIGNVVLGECGAFTFKTSVAIGTQLGITHCTEAHIFPDSICVIPTNWSGADIDVTTTCLTDSIQFKIKNIGFANMSQQLNYFVIEDDLIMLQNPFILNQGDSLLVSVPTTGATFRLIAEEEINHPFSQYATSVIENCANNSVVSLGFMNTFPNDDGLPFLSVDCSQNIGSYDPNDKQGYPLGVGTTHDILQNIPIDYKIRFQNTGTDTAFRIVIRDTIDTDLLDITNITFGASSHAYQVQMEGQGILIFTFANIMLPDSNINEAASHGFVKFKIMQQTDNPIGTLIENNAAIYFDANPPIITNTAFHTISQFPFLVLVNEPKLPSLPSVKVFPNPLSERATFYINDEQPRDLQFIVYDISGRVVFQEQHQQTYQFDFYKNALSSGMYFYTIQEDGKNINQGKIIVQ